MVVFLVLLGIVVYPDTDQFYSLLAHSKLKPLVMLFVGRGMERASKIWEKVAGHYNNNRKVTIAEFSCQGRRDFCWGIGVKQVPAIQCHFGPDIVVAYQGVLKTDSIITWIDRMIEKPVQNLTYPHVWDTDCVSFVLSSHSEHQRSFVKTAYAFKNTSAKFYVGNVTDSLVAVYDDLFNVSIHEELDEQSISNFVWRNQFQLVEELTFHNFHARRSTRRYMVIVALDALIQTDPVSFNNMMVRLRAIAKHHFSNLSVVWGDGHSMAPHLDGYEIHTLPSFVVLDNTLTQEYFFASDNISNLEDLLDDITSGQLEPRRVATGKRVKMLVKFVCLRYTLAVIVLTFLLITFFVILFFLVRELRKLRRQTRRYYTKLEEKKTH